MVRFTVHFNSITDVKDLFISSIHSHTMSISSGRYVVDAKSMVFQPDCNAQSASSYSDMR